MEETAKTKSCTKTNLWTKNGLARICRKAETDRGIAEEKVRVNRPCADGATEELAENPDRSDVAQTYRKLLLTVPVR